MRNKLSSAALGKFFRRRQKATFGILSNEEVLPSCSASRTVSRRIILVDQIVSHQSVPTNRYFSATKKTQTGGGKRKYVPRKAAVQLTDRARTFFKRYAVVRNTEEADLLMANSYHNALKILVVEKALGRQPRESWHNALLQTGFIGTT